MSESDQKPEMAEGGGADMGRGDSVSTQIALDVVAGSTLPSAGSSTGNIHEFVLPTDKTVISKRLLSTDVAPPVPSTSQSLGAALVGKTFGNYELAEFVGGGGMGAVFRATDTSMGRTVAVKVLSRDHTDEETIRRFRNEAHSAARLDHPNIARAYYVGEHEGWSYIVFEFVQGINLRDLVDKQGPLPVEQALNYTLQVAQALDHAAGRDVVHRDIKPSNVLVTPAGEIKLVDMGLARLHQVESSSDDLIASGVTLGTFDYISP
ncbi:MAG: serine/threonine protein kinase, partial [Pirellulaceae bacterium]|nr:serine/threonine protein kinase [Pirellulaceae bacterium]